MTAKWRGGGGKEEEGEGEEEEEEEEEQSFCLIHGHCSSFYLGAGGIDCSRVSTLHHPCTFHQLVLK